MLQPSSQSYKNLTPGNRLPGQSGLWGVWTLVALTLMVVLSACNVSSAPDKRLLQYLNRDGFGNRYTGNAEEENYVTIGDTIAFVDVIRPDELSSTQKVDIDGTVLLPDLGVVCMWLATRVATCVLI